MSFSWLVSVLVFTLVAAISPGPVNLFALSAGISGKVRQGLLFVLGATTGYCLLLLACGLGLQTFLEAFPRLLTALKWLGAGFILWLASLLWRSDGQIEKAATTHVTFFNGALLQWLNPKAYIASLAAISLFAPHDLSALLALSSIYYVVCFCSIACWLLLGKLLSQFLHDARKVRLFNRTLAVMLSLSVVYLIAGTALA